MRSEKQAKQKKSSGLMMCQSTKRVGIKKTYKLYLPLVCEQRSGKYSDAQMTTLKHYTIKIIKSKSNNNNMCECVVIEKGRHETAAASFVIVLRPPSVFSK